MMNADITIKNISPELAMGLVVLSAIMEVHFSVGNTRFIKSSDVLLCTFTVAIHAFKFNKVIFK